MNSTHSIKLQTGSIAAQNGAQMDDSTRGNAKYACRFVRAGRVRSADNSPAALSIPAAVLQAALSGGHFEGKAVFIDHAAPLGAPSLRNLVGVSSQAAWNAENQAVDGVIQFYDTGDGRQAAILLNQLLAQAGQAPDVGLSLVFWCDQNPSEDGGADIAAIRHVESIDLVFQPAAGGRVLHALSAALPHDQNDPLIQLSNGGEMTIQDTLLENKMKPPEGQNSLAQPAQERPEALQAALTAMTRSAAQVIITHAGLPRVSQERLLGMNFNSPAEVQDAIESERGYLAALVEDQTVQMQGKAPRSPHIQMGRSGFDQLQLAASALMDGVRPPDGVRPLSGIRELYNLLSGDYELTGLFHPERVQFANVNSTTMASLVADAINKRVVNEFSQYPHWWEPFTMAEDFESLQDVRWITLAGIGELPTV